MVTNKANGGPEQNLELVQKVQVHLDQDTAALCFIAQYIAEKISPARSIHASIDLLEELMMEDAINSLKNAGIKKVLLVINSFGGGVSSSYDLLPRPKGRGILGCS